jgi:hypothetical protein
MRECEVGRGWTGLDLAAPSTRAAHVAAVESAFCAELPVRAVTIGDRACERVGDRRIGPHADAGAETTEEEDKHSNASQMI